MGTTSSKNAAATIHPHHADLQFLADRFPFGDAELHRLYEAYMAITDTTTTTHNNRTTFLQDWAVHSWLQKHCGSWKRKPIPTTDDNEESRQAEAQERRLVVQVVEEQILEPWTGNTLYQVACCPPGDPNPLYTVNDSSSSSSNTSNVMVDECTRKARLEHMFNGFTQMGRKGAKAATQVLFQVVTAHHAWPDDSTQQQQQPPVRIHALSLAKLAYSLALATAFLEAAAADDELGMAQFTTHHDKSEHALKAMALSMIAKGKVRLDQSSMLISDDNNQVDKEQAKQALEQGYIEWDDLWEWTEDVGPLMASILPSFVQTLLFPEQPAPPSRTAYKFPRLSQASVFFDSPTSGSLFLLACLSASLSGTYYRLYTSASDGLSFNRLLHALLGYGGPTLLVIQSTDGAVFGAFTGAPWKESKDFYGTSDSFLYQLSPVTAVYRPKPSGQPNYMYCNSYARSKGYDQQAHGIGFGGTLDQPRLFLAETFDYNDNYAGSQDVAYENGPFLPANEAGVYPKNFEVEALEVWGVGGDEVVQQALGEQSKVRSIREEGIRRAKKVDRAAFLDDLRSGVIDNKLFQHRQQVDGRTDVIDEKEKYEYTE